MAAIVQQDSVPAANLFYYLLFDYGSRRSVPVVACHIPHHGLKAQFTGDAENRGTPSAERGAKEIGMLADRAPQGGATVSEFLANVRCALENQQRVREGVVAND